MNAQLDAVRSHRVSGPVAPGVSLRRVTRSELTKLLSVRSSLLTLSGAWIAMVGIGVLVARLGADSQLKNPDSSYDPTGNALVGSMLAILAVAVLGVLVISAEYSSGMIRNSMSAVPARLPVLWAKAIVVTVSTFVAMASASIVAFLLGQLVTSGLHYSNGSSLTVGLGDPGVFRAVIGCALSMTLVAVIALGLGTALRSTAAGISASLGLLLVAPAIVSFIPGSIGKLNKYLPSDAGSAMWAVHRSSGSLSPGAATAVLAGWSVAALLVAAIMLRKRDV
ncbi:MAG: ABC transporter permease [Actinomycetota bacterium]|nr:ABC transporter permease [Actinomycetota bacterium]